MNENYLDENKLDIDNTSREERMKQLRDNLKEELKKNENAQNSTFSRTGNQAIPEGINNNVYNNNQVNNDRSKGTVNPYADEDKGGCLLALVGMLFPYVGGILYLVWRKKRPNSALAVGKGSLITVLIILIILIIKYSIGYLTRYFS